jgi:predicted anti-sigma-YlaC factor YlaD
MQIMIYMLAVYLVFKGFEIFQIALMSSRENRWAGLILGVVLIGFAVVAGIGFSIGAITQHKRSVNE